MIRNVLETICNCHEVDMGQRLRCLADRGLLPSLLSPSHSLSFSPNPRSDPLTRRPTFPIQLERVRFPKRRISWNINARNFKLITILRRKQIFIATITLLVGSEVRYWVPQPQWIRGCNSAYPNGVHDSLLIYQSCRIALSHLALLSPA